MSNQRLFNEPTGVAVCVATFQRPQALQCLLDALALLTFKKAAEPSLQVLVVDNDAARSAEIVCRFASTRWPVRYICEPRQGIAFARNRAIECAASSEFVAFIDDDEVPASQWLDELLFTQSRFQADVVSGALIPVFSEDVPNWIRHGKFFDRPIFATGSPVQLCSTGNVLIRSHVFAAVPGFDERFNLSGGEDTHFFLRVREAGFRLVFSRESVVYEPIAAERANPKWLLRRGFQAGNSWAHCEKSLKPGWRAAFVRVAKEIVHFARGALCLLLAPFAGRGQLVRALQIVSGSLGTVAGVFGYRFSPYKNAQGHAIFGEGDAKQARSGIELGPMQ